MDRVLEFWEENASYLHDLSPLELGKLRRLVDERVQAEVGDQPYKEGKIYGLMETTSSGDTLVYCGSTCTTLQLRLCGHKSAALGGGATPIYRYMRENGPSENFKIQLLEHFPCTCRKELETREMYWIQNLEPVCNVIGIPSRSPPSGLPVASRPGENLPTPPKTSLHDLGYDTAYDLIGTMSAEQYLESFAQVDSIDESHPRSKEQRILYELDEMLGAVSSMWDGVRADTYKAMISDGTSEAFVIHKMHEFNQDFERRADHMSFRYRVHPRSAQDIRKLCQLLGIRSTHDDQSIVSHEALERNTVALKDAIGRLESNFCGQIRHRSRSQRPWSPEAQLKTDISHVFRKWSGTSLKVARIRDRMVSGVRRISTDYQIDLSGPCRRILPLLKSMDQTVW